MLLLFLLVSLPERCLFRTIPMRPCQALDTILNALDGIYLCLGQIFNLRRVSCTGSPVSTSTSEESANVQKQVPWSGKLDARGILLGYNCEGPGSSLYIAGFLSYLAH